MAGEPGLLTAWRPLVLPRSEQGSPPWFAKWKVLRTVPNAPLTLVVLGPVSNSPGGHSETEEHSSTGPCLRSDTAR